jgi:hypothetical protein
MKLSMMSHKHCHQLFFTRKSGHTIYFLSGITSDANQRFPPKIKKGKEFLLKLSKMKKKFEPDVAIAQVKACFLRKIYTRRNNF